VPFNRALSAVQSGSPYRTEKLADLDLEAIAVAGQRLRGGEDL
jgi:hypothetical protein